MVGQALLRPLGVCSVIHGLSHMVAGMEVLHGPTIWTFFPKADVAATDQAPNLTTAEINVEPQQYGLFIWQGAYRHGPHWFDHIPLHL